MFVILLVGFGTIINTIFGIAIEKTVHSKEHNININIELELDIDGNNVSNHTDQNPSHPKDNDSYGIMDSEYEDYYHEKHDYYRK